ATYSPRLDTSFSIWLGVMSYVFSTPGKPVRRIPIKPVSFITSSTSVNGPRRKWFQSPRLSAHRMFLLAGSFAAAAARPAAMLPRKARRFISSSSMPLSGDAVFSYRVLIQLDAQAGLLGDCQIAVLGSQFLARQKFPKVGLFFRHELANQRVRDRIQPV